MIMVYRSLITLGLCAALLGGTVGAAEKPVSEGIRNLAYGHALYEYFQDRYFTAITRLLVARDRQRLRKLDGEADLLLGNLYYDFGLIPDAAELFDKLLEENSPDDLKNRVWFNMARVEYEQGNYRNAAVLLQRLEGRLGEEKEAQKDYLLLRLHLLADNVELAREVVQRIPRDSVWRDYGEYNIGIALIAKNHFKGARSWLLSVSDRSGPINTPERQSLSDAARLAAGLASLRDGKWGQAIDDLRLVHIDGPLSNTALLATAWAWHNQGNPLQAMGMLQRIVDKKQLDATTREAYVVMGQIQEQSGNLKLAAWYYNRAARYLQTALSDIDRVIDSVSSGELIQMLLDQGLIRTHGRDALQRAPKSEASPYLVEAMADDIFQRQLRDLQQLVDIRDRLRDWQQKIPTYELMLKERLRAFYERRPIIEQSADLGRVGALRSRRQHFADAVDRIERDQDARALASEAEAEQLARLDDIRDLLTELRGSRDLNEAEQRYRLLNGLLVWELETTFPRRLWALKHELQQLDRALDESTRAADSLRSASHRHQARLVDLSRRIEGRGDLIATRLASTESLIEAQQKAINERIVERLKTLRRHALQLHLSAHYSVARLYDKLAEPKPARSKQSGGAQ